LPTAVVKFLQDLQDSRYYTFLYVSVWKTFCYFCMVLVSTYFQSGSSGVEELFSATISKRTITVTEVRTTFTDVGKKKNF
jgi:chitin synthase